MATQDPFGMEALRREIRRRRRQADTHDPPASAYGKEGAGGQQGATGASLEPGSEKPIWERILERAERIPDEEVANLPADLTEQHDHYIYGTPKRS